MPQSYEPWDENAAMSTEAAVASGLTPELTAKAETAVALLREALIKHGRVVYASSLGAEAIVLTDLIWTRAADIDIVTIDTGRLPDETLQLLERIERRYGRRIQVFYPDAGAVEGYVRGNGINGFYNSLEQRLACCHVRKVEPFKRAVAGYAAWVTGVRRGQSELRSYAQPVSLDEQSGLTKYSPLLEWTEQDIWDYIRALKLPYNPLHDRGYPSIGCAPCSRAIQPGEDQRAGRWWWENPDSRECGLQPRQRPASV
jgi:phosphoadenosine phosphosulfate reductase